jgi:hypothetical protein
MFYDRGPPEVAEQTCAWESGVSWIAHPDERLGLPLFRRPQPPVQLRGLAPDRILVGHGEPVTERAGDALANTLDGARRTLPRALVETGPPALRGALAAVRN